MIMDSINKNQSEENYKALNGQPAIDKIKELAEKAETCFFCTGIQEGMEIKTRPMALQQIDEEGNLWFLSASDSHKNHEISQNPAVQLFSRDLHIPIFYRYMEKHLSATIKIKIEQLWKPLLKTWFTEGKEDPRITVIQVTPSNGYYWDNKHGNTMAFAKMVTGAIIGKTLDDSVEGKLNV